MLNTDSLSTTEELLEDLESWRETYNNPGATVESETRASRRIEEIATELNSRGVEVEY